MDTIDLLAVGTGYQPAASLADTSKPKRFFGSIDPDTVPGVVFGNNSEPDTWFDSTPAGVTPPPPPPPPTLITFSDFTANGGLEGLMIPATGLVAAPGTVYEMLAHTSTKSAPSSGTNQLNLIRTLAGGGTKGGEYANFELRGTAQGHNFNGINFDHLLNHYVHDLLINGIQGSGHSPPGETFLLNEFGGVNGLFERIECDGHLLSSGARVGASVGMNSATNTTLTDWYTHDLEYGFPTSWEQNGLTTNNYRSINNQLGYNHERCNGPIRHYGFQAHPDPANTTAMHFTLNNDLADNPDVEIHMASWSNGAKASFGLLCVLIGHSYDPLSVGNTQHQVSLPKVYNADDELMSWADAGYGAGGIPSSNMAAAQADPTHWVVRFH